MAWCSPRAARSGGALVGVECLRMVDEYARSGRGRYAADHPRRDGVDVDRRAGCAGRLRRRRRAVRCAYFFVRLLHLVLSILVVRDDPDASARCSDSLRPRCSAPRCSCSPASSKGTTRIAVWLAALAIDYLGPAVIGVGRGWAIAPEHFAERHGLIILIALGESTHCHWPRCWLRSGPGSDRGGAAW